MAFRKILLVDDSETILQMEQMILAPDSYELIMARNGEEGVAKALATKPDLILMDIRLPDMDGTEAVRRLKADERTAGIPVVALTALAMTGEPLDCVMSPLVVRSEITPSGAPAE